MRVYVKTILVLAEPFTLPNGYYGYNVIDENGEEKWWPKTTFENVHKRLNGGELDMMDRVNYLFYDVYRNSAKAETSDSYFDSEYPYELRQVGDSAEFLGNDGKWHPIEQFDCYTGKEVRDTKTAKGEEYDINI
jgi:hypothetical protein